MTNVSWVTYRRAFYRADAGGGNEIEIRIGKRTPALDDLLGREGKRRWAFLTACNPGARRLGAAENRVRTSALRSSLRTGGFLLFEGRSGSGAGDWPEEASFLVVGISRRQADRLRRRFGQDAFVTGLRGGAAHLCPGGRTAAKRGS
jgi:Protein of unknown function (DUF3293)